MDSQCNKKVFREQLCTVHYTKHNTEEDFMYVYATGMIVILSIVYLTPVLVFLIKRQPEFFMWYAIYLVAMPIFTTIIPVYSFWKFDDFVNTEISNKSTIGITIEE
jgi:hypothetical protein